MATNEEKRLRRILLDEDYGPKLVRLNPRDQREILDLISENRGKDARRRITELDEQRRSAMRRPAKGARRTLAAKRRDAIENINRRLEGLANQSRVIIGVSHMRDDELDFAIQANAEQLRNAARQAPTVSTREGDINPFWYH